MINTVGMTMGNNLVYYVKIGRQVLTIEIMGERMYLLFGQLINYLHRNKLAGMKATLLLEIRQASTTRHHNCASFHFTS